MQSPTAAPSNRQNNAGQFAPEGQNRSSQIITNVLPAGQIFPVFQPGDAFYLVVATGKLLIKPNTGSENEYVQGTGLRPGNNSIFKQVQLKNPNTFPVVFQLFVGFGDYIDNRLIVNDPNQIQAVYPTSPLANTSNNIAIPDLSGQAFNDINGVPMLALNRVGIYVSNIDLALTYDLRNNADTATAISIMPITSIVFPANGNFRIKTPSANINGTVSEIYNAIRAT
jgi:hypothetical protein